MAAEPRFAVELLPAEARAPWAALEPAAGLFQLDCATQRDAPELEAAPVQPLATPERPLLDLLVLKRRALERLVLKPPAPE